MLLAKTSPSDSVISFGDVDITLANIIAILIIIAGTFILLRIISVLLAKNSKKLKLDPSRTKSVAQIFKYIIWIVVLIICLDLIGVKITLLLASGAALLVGVGFAMQNVFSDFISGIIILFDGSVQIDHVLEVDDQVGRVTSIKLRNTTIITPDDYHVLVPNHYFISDKVKNYSYSTQSSRFSVSVGVAYGSDTKLVETLLLACTTSHNLVGKKPKPFVRFANFGDSALEFELIFWTDQEFYNEQIKSDLRFMIDKAFRANNIKIPFPQRDIHIQTPISSSNLG